MRRLALLLLLAATIGAWPNGPAVIAAQNDATPTPSAAALESLPLGEDVFATLTVDDLIELAGLADPLITGAIEDGVDAVSDAGKRSDPEKSVSGRLGGPRASFDEMYAEGARPHDKLGTIYLVRGVGIMWPAYGDDDRALVINVLTPRSPDTPSDQPDAADWSIDVALDVVKSFLPKDAVAADANYGKTDAASALCFSGALGKVVSQATYESLGLTGDAGGCGYALGPTSASTVSVVKVAIASVRKPAEEPKPKPSPTPKPQPTEEADSCELLGTWGQATLTRFNRAVAIFDELETIDPTDPQVGAQLHDWATEFLEMSKDQRRSGPPASAKDANRLFVRAYADLSVAMDAAAIGLTTENFPSVYEALGRIDDASLKVQQAAELLIPLFEACGFD